MKQQTGLTEYRQSQTGMTPSGPLSLISISRFITQQHHLCFFLNAASSSISTQQDNKRWLQYRLDGVNSPKRNPCGGLLTFFSCLIMWCMSLEGSLDRENQGIMNCTSLRLVAGKVSSRMKTSWITSNATRHSQHLQPHENTLCRSSSAFSSSRCHGNIPPWKNLPLRRPWWRSYDRPRRIHSRLILGL